MAVQIGSMDELLALEERLKRTWGPRNALIEEMRELRFMERRPDVPVEIEPEVVISPYAYTYVRQAVGLLTADPVVIRVPPADEGDAALEASSRLEVFLHALLAQLSRQADDDVVERFIECLIADGHGCMRCLWAPQLWRGYPRRAKGQAEAEYNKESDQWVRSRPIPISLSWVDPLNVYPLWSEAGLEGVLEVDQRDLLGLDPARFNLVVDRRGRVQPELWDFAREAGQQGPLTFRQLWTRDRLIYAVEDRIVHEAAHSYGLPPYIYAMGDTISTRDPGKMGLSMLYPLRYLQPYFDRLLSQRGTGIRFATWPTLVYEQAPGLLPEGGEAEEGELLQILPGKVLPLRPGEKVYFLGWQGSGPEIDKQVAMVRAMMDQATLPGVMYGDAGGVNTGYAINQLQTAARVQFKPTVAHASRALEQLCALLLDIIERQARQRVYVYVAPGKEARPGKRGQRGRGRASGWIGLGPEEIRGWRQVEVEVKRVLPTDRYALSSMIINERNARLRSDLSAMEELGFEQPDAEYARMLIEDWHKTPEVRALMTSEGLRRAGVRLQMPQTSPGELARLLPQTPPALQQAIVAWLQAQGGAGVGPGGPGGPDGQASGLGAAGPNVAGLPEAAVLAAPGVQAAPGAPTPPALAGHVGPVSRPSGVGTGREPGVRRKAVE